MRCRKIALFGVMTNVLLCGQVWGVSVFDKAGVGQRTLERSVVMIRSVQQEFDYVTPWKQASMGQGIGSGFVIAGRRILTNAHNASNCKYVEVRKEYLAKRYPAKVAFIGHDCDLAILTVDDDSFFDDMVPLEFGDIPKVNTTVQTYGFPVGGRRISVTEGVVSRVQMDVYSHSRADSHLVIQTDAAINPGNSGGPVLQDGKVVGVAFQGLREAENIGYLIPTTVIEHFLNDIEDGKYDGFGSIGFAFFPGLHSRSYADYLKVPAGQQGIVVLRTMLNSSVEAVLQAGDVITKVDQFDIDNDGMIQIYGLRLHMAEAIERKQMGENVELTFYRNGELNKATAVAALNRPVLAYWREYDIPPRYEVFAGLTFVPVSRNFLESWGRTWITDIPFYLRYLFNDSDQLNTDRQRKEYVVLSEILPDEVNSYCSAFRNEVAESVNGVDIRSLDDLRSAFAKGSNGFCIIKFMGTPTPLILDSAKANEHHPGIMTKYQVPAESNLEGKL
jgi:S1-C subfamily serine protease